MRVLITGGCGFIGSHFVEHLLNSDPQVRVVNLDCLTYAAHPDTMGYLEKLAPDRYELVRMDIGDPEVLEVCRARGVEAIVNFAAESHVDRSILDPGAFVRTNIVGVQNLLTVARELGKVPFVQVSTDEVYGTLTPEEGPFTENNHLDPNSPYAASKAAADLMALASCRTYEQPVMITRCSNNYGPFQFPEKLLPVVIANALEDKPIPVYGDGKQVRDWIYVKDHCAAVEKVLRRGQSGRVYNIGASNEIKNLDIIELVLKELGKPTSLMEHVRDRPAHDRRYAIDSSRIQSELGWTPSLSFEEGLKKTITWYLENEEWWKKVRDKDFYKQYYNANYSEKFARQGKV